MMASPIPLTVPRALFLLGVQGKTEDRQALAQLWSLFPSASTLDELKKKVGEALAMKEGLDTLLNSDLSLEQIAAKLRETGVLP